MTSYQRRKEEVKKQKEQLNAARSLAMEVKHYFLALARGQEAHAEQCKRAIMKRMPEFVYICDSEKGELNI